MVLMSGRGSGLELRGRVGGGSGADTSTQEDARSGGNARIQTFLRHRACIFKHRAQRRPSRAAISMEMALIVPTDHT